MGFGRERDDGRGFGDGGGGGFAETGVELAVDGVGGVGKGLVFGFRDCGGGFGGWVEGFWEDGFGDEVFGLFRDA